MTTVQAQVNAGRSRLRQAGLEFDAAGRDAEVLARAALGWDKATYLTHGRSAPPHGFCDRYVSMLQRRIRREPVSLILGHREFWGLDFEVTSDVLTPRPETELLVEEAVWYLSRQMGQTPHVVDVGTGSGCVAVAIAREVRRCRITATDVSPHALPVARRNIIRHRVADRVSLVCGPLIDGVVGQPDVIVANLPYVPQSELETLPPEVREFEPWVALAGGHDGLNTIRRLIDVSNERLKEGGVLIIEFGIGQVDAIRHYVSRFHKLTVVRIRRDLQGIIRAAVIERNADVGTARATSL